MKKLICTSSNDDFIVGTLVMLYSLKKNFKLINEFDIKIYYDSDMKYGSISNENKEMIKKVFPNVIFDNNSDKRFRNALSISIDRQLINEALYFGLALESKEWRVAYEGFFSDCKSHGS